MGDLADHEPQLGDVKNVLDTVVTDVVMPSTEWLMAPHAPELDELICRPTWHSRAACRGEVPDVFFPSEKGNYERAKAICARCEVRQDCLAAALAHPEAWGYWGGTSERERRRIRRRAA